MIVAGERLPRPWALRLLPDFWTFFCIISLTAGVFIIGWPLKLFDRLAGTRLVASFIRLVEWIGDL